MGERWAKITEFPTYGVSNYGRVSNLTTGRIMAQSQNQYEVATVGLMWHGQQFHRSVAKLVAHAFLPTIGPAFDTPINLDGDRMNNCVDNLAWRPRWFAVKYNRQFKTEFKDRISRRIIDTETGEIYKSSLEVAKINGLLELDVVLSILNNTVTWPTYQKFEVMLE